ncbi:hypothetical protein BDZ45DRAFT_786935, partial [Acephala macrosclerotiorum]
FLMAQDKSGKINYSKAIGNDSPEPSAQPMQIDNTFWPNSVSKQITIIAVLQSWIVHSTLDEDATRILLEFKDIQILTGFDEKTGEPIALPTRTKLL